ncbi:MAG: hypothetical protein IJT91_02720 [Clostridia bacterium]|nr:hypothetical protein [Clostridia bacterium]
MYSRSTSRRNGYGLVPPPFYGGTAIKRGGARPKDAPAETAAKIHPSPERLEGRRPIGPGIGKSGLSQEPARYKPAIPLPPDDVRGSCEPPSEDFFEPTDKPHHNNDGLHSLISSEGPDDFFEPTDEPQRHNGGLRPLISPERPDDFFEPSDKPHHNNDGLRPLISSERPDDFFKPTDEPQRHNGGLRPLISSERPDDILLASLIALLFANRSDDELLLILVLLYIMGI